jgi:hypothetical protein
MHIEHDITIYDPKKKKLNMFSKKKKKKKLNILVN